MKPLLKIVDTQQNSAFQIMKVNEAHFFPSWHFHPEYEIMLVQDGTGIRFAGDSMERFSQGDLVFMEQIFHTFIAAIKSIMITKIPISVLRLPWYILKKIFLERVSGNYPMFPLSKNYSCYLKEE